MAELDERLNGLSKHNDSAGQIRKFFVNGINGYQERLEFELIVSSCGAKVQDFIIDYETQVIEYFVTTHNFYKFLEKLLGTRYSQCITFKKVVLKYDSCSKTR